MFTNKIASYYSQDKVLIEAACLSTDTKPTTGVANGSKCIEMDTGKRYMFNEEDSEWEELPSSGGGGGTTVEALSVTQNGTYTAPSGKAYSPVTVNVSGGSSDFSTATVTFDNKTSHSVYDIFGCFAFNGEDGDPDISYPQATAEENVVSTYNLILYKGTAGILILDNNVTLLLSGDIEGDAGEYLVTGDCTIRMMTQS